MTRRFSLLPALALLLASGTAHAADTCHTGAYALSDGSEFVVQPSDANNLRYRFLDGASGRLYRVSENRYETGDGWAVREPVTLRVEFSGCNDGIVRMDRGRSPSLQGRKINLPKTPISFDSGSLRLCGELVMPAKEQARAVVVLQYGSGHDSAVVNNYVQYLLPLRDIAVFVFDKRGTGRSTGEYSIDITPLARDLAAAVDAVRTHIGMNDIPLGLMGESQGGWVAPLAATMTPVDFVVVSYGLAVSMLEEDRLEVAQSLRMSGYDADVLAKGEQLHRAAAKVMMSRFSEGLVELERLKAAYGSEPWFEKIGGDFTAPLTSTPAEQLLEVQALFDFPYDLAYDPLPTLEALDTPQLWILAGDDTEAPHEPTLAVLRQLESQGAPIEVAVFPDAEHGMIAVEQGPEGRKLVGRTAEGYFELLFDWIGAQGNTASEQARAGR
ncbi:MAG: alpha/beta fold hydrolase [Woeseia sp.]